MTSKGNWNDVGLGLSRETYLDADDFTLRNNSRFLIENKFKYLEALNNSGTEKNILDRIISLETLILFQKCENSSVSREQQSATVEISAEILRESILYTTSCDWCSKSCLGIQRLKFTYN